MHDTPNKRYLGVFQLVMFAIVSVDSLRNLPIGAQYGLSLVTCYVFAGIAFFLPLAWTASQLAVKFPNVGGSYLWVEAAFGKTVGYLSIWLQWSYNIIWYPTIFAFISSTIASLIHPDLEQNTWFILITCVSLFWFITYIHSYGLRASSWVSTISAIVGTLLPMLLIMGLAIYWLLSGHPSATPLTLQGLIPDTTMLKNSAYFSNILFSLLGLEVIAVHAGNVIHPKTMYPRSFLISAIIILSTLIFSSLALCIVIPFGNISLLSGIMDVFTLFLAKQPRIELILVGWCIVVGGLGIASSWMIGLARGLHVALTSTNAPRRLLALNKNNVPIYVMCFQGIIYTLLLSAFLLLPNVNSSYWLLSVISAQFALLYYVLLFSAAIKLFQSIPQTKWRRWLGMVLPSSAMVVSVIGIGVGFIPPTMIEPDKVLQYELFMIISLIIFCLIPFLIFRKKHTQGTSK